MNLFVLDRDPIIAAQYNADQHVIKIILEATQMLEYAHGRKGRYYNHPVSKWVRECTGNYKWTSLHLAQLCEEYKERYYKEHSYIKKVVWLCLNFPKDIPDKELSYFHQGVPDDCRSMDAVEGYRKYYLKYKMHFAKWKNGNIPPFVKEYYESQKTSSLL